MCARRVIYAANKTSALKQNGNRALFSASRKIKRKAHSTETMSWNCVFGFIIGSGSRRVATESAMDHNGDCLPSAFPVFAFGRSDTTHGSLDRRHGWVENDIFYNKTWLSDTRRKFSSRWTGEETRGTFSNWDFQFSLGAPVHCWLDSR